MDPIPEDLATQRVALHRLATYVIAPARYAVTQRFGLRSTPGGFATPVFGDDQRIRVEKNLLIVEEAGKSRSRTITTLVDAAAFIGSVIDPKSAAEDDSPPLGDVDAPLGVTAEVVDFLGAWWATGTAALETLRGDEATVDPTIVQLWPGHFDVAIEAGDEDRRASYGASPGDGSFDEPYLYVSVWWPDRLRLDLEDPLWNADGYVGAVLPFAELARAADPAVAAEVFFADGRDMLARA